jgi:hypothetical protein
VSEGSCRSSASKLAAFSSTTLGSFKGRAQVPSNKASNKRERKRAMSELGCAGWRFNPTNAGIPLYCCTPRCHRRRRTTACVVTGLAASRCFTGRAIVLAVASPRAHALGCVHLSTDAITAACTCAQLVLLVPTVELHSYVLRFALCST